MQIWLEDSVAATDALYRFGLGLDLKDRVMLTTALAADAEFDYRATAAAFGLQVPLLAGRDTIIDNALAAFADLDTTHTITNPHVTITGDVAAITALAEAQHMLKADHDRFALVKNRYTADLVRDGAIWTIRRLRLEPLWHSGDPAVIFGARVPTA